MEGFRKCELHGSKEAASSSGERTMETLSFRDAVVSLIASEKIPLAYCTRVYSEIVNDTDSMSSESMSSDFGDTWHQGCLKCLEW